MKGKYLGISVGIVAAVAIIVGCVVILLHKRESGIVETSSVQESVEQTRPEVLLDESSAEGTSEVAVAEFDWSGYEYWQQNVLNTIAKTISDCSDNEVVKVMDIQMGEEVGHIVVEKDGTIYEADFDVKSYAILNE